MDRARFGPCLVLSAGSDDRSVLGRSAKNLGTPGAGEADLRVSSRAGRPERAGPGQSPGQGFLGRSAKNLGSAGEADLRVSSRAGRPERAGPGAEPRTRVRQTSKPRKLLRSEAPLRPSSEAQGRSEELAERSAAALGALMRLSQTLKVKWKKPESRALRGLSGFFGEKSRRRPTLPQGYPCSTIGSEELNFRVRDGIGCGLFEITTGNCGSTATGA